MAAPIQFIKINAEKKMYLIEMKNSVGETRNEWMDEGMIKFMDPEFLDRFSDEHEPSVANTVGVKAKSAQKKAKSHEDSSDLKCDGCGHVFKRRDHLKEHIRKKHSDDKEEYSCLECDSKFGYRSNWTQHMTRKHKWSAGEAKKRIEEAKSVVPNSEIDDMPLSVGFKKTLRKR